MKIDLYKLKVIETVGANINSKNSILQCQIIRNCHNYE